MRAMRSARSSKLFSSSAKGSFGDAADRGPRRTSRCRWRAAPGRSAAACRARAGRRAGRPGRCPRSAAKARPLFSSAPSVAEAAQEHRDRDVVERDGHRTPPHASPRRAWARNPATDQAGRQRGVSGGGAEWWHDPTAARSPCFSAPCRPGPGSTTTSARARRWSAARCCRSAPSSRSSRRRSTPG